MKGRTRRTRRSRPSWRSNDSQPIRPELWLVAAVAIGMLLVEVWQSSKVTELSLSIGQTRSALFETQTHVEHLRVQKERRITRAELAPTARKLGLEPAQAQQVVALPTAYLADGRSTGRTANQPFYVVWAERASRFLVPEATARGRIR
jgi:hypothetical protein